MIHRGFKHSTLIFIIRNNIVILTTVARIVSVLLLSCLVLGKHLFNHYLGLL